jgi:DNA-binding winged helix-turn-helix (wHTH) protein
VTNDLLVAADRTIVFGPFRLVPTQRLLLEDCTPVPIGSRALDILIALVERRGNLVTKDELMAQAWPKATVVEANLAVQIAAVRRAIRDTDGSRRVVVTTPGRGYTFVAPVMISGDVADGRAFWQPSGLLQRWRPLAEL